MSRGVFLAVNVSDMADLNPAGFLLSGQI